jgi:signal peptidase I
MMRLWPTPRRNEVSDEGSASSDFEDNLATSSIDSWLREASLAVGLVILLLGSMWISTGSFPPMVVVESQSMMHDPEGSIGSIDPGDLILVMNKDRVDIVTFVEATQEGNEHYGHESHGMPGDVIIYRKNGGQDTPVIHRAILEVVSNGTGWDVLGTSLRNVETVSLILDYECSSYHGGNYNLRIDGWEPEHSGFLTSGDNNFGGCMIDQPSANSQGQGGGLVDENGNPVEPVLDDWVVGVASSEIPWIGTIKLATSGTSASVTMKSWISLTLTILVILASPIAVESLMTLNPNKDEEE